MPPTWGGQRQVEEEEEMVVSVVSVAVAGTVSRVGRGQQRKHNDPPNFVRPHQQRPQGKMVVVVVVVMMVVVVVGKARVR